MKFIGTYLEPEDHKALKVKAAQSGQSLSGFLKAMALASISRPTSKRPTAKKGVAK